MTMKSSLNSIGPSLNHNFSLVAGAGAPRDVFGPAEFGSHLGIGVGELRNQTPG